MAARSPYAFPPGRDRCAEPSARKSAIPDLSQMVKGEGNLLRLVDQAERRRKAQARGDSAAFAAGGVAPGGQAIVQTRPAHPPVHVAGVRARLPRGRAAILWNPVRPPRR